jgi:hypothetical protein
MPKKHQNDPRSAQKRPQNDPKTTKKAIPNDKTKKGPNQDDLGTILDRPRADLHSSAAPPGCHLGGQNGTKIDPKTIKNRSEKSRVKKTDPRRSWIRLEAILGRLGCHLGALETLWHYACRCFVNIHFFDVKTVRRRSWDQLWPTKAPKRPKMTPKTEPKSTSRRSKIDVKIDIKNDAKTKRAWRLLTRAVWVGTPPQGPPGRRPRDPGEAAQAPWDL